MLINLLEIPPDGKDFYLTEADRRLSESLADLVGDSSFQTSFSINPMQIGTYELRGQIKTQADEACSRCGLDFKLAVDQKFHEILMPRTADHSEGSGNHHVADEQVSGPSVYEYDGHHLNIGEYLHEAIALSIPYIPAPACDKNGNCSVCKKNVKLESFNYEDPGFEKPVSPFESLKNLKINKS